MDSINNYYLHWFYLLEIKLEKFQEAVEDCNKVLSAEPNNVKGTFVYCIYCKTFFFRSHEKYNRLRPAYSASIACANEATMIKRFNYTNTLLLSARAASGWYDASLTSLFSETKGFFCFSFNKRCPKDAARKTEFFAYVISRKRRANQRKKIQGNVCWLKRSPHAKIETNPKKKKKTAQHST